MWQMVNTTPFQTAGTFLRDADGHEYWCMAIRASFVTDGNGAVALAPTQIPVQMMPAYAGPENDILVSEDDFIPFAPLTDILVHGTILPAAEAVAAPLSLEVGRLVKRATVLPPRRARLHRGHWRIVDQGRNGPVAPGWQVSFGGLPPGPPDDAPPLNPAGCGIWLRTPDRFPDGTETDLPRIEGAGSDCIRDPFAARPVGFGPVARWWRDRLALAGSFDDAWRRDRSPAMPADHDPRFHCSAPRDQWPARHLAGGEPVVLRGFLGARDWAFRLPQVLFRVETRFARRVVPSQMHFARLDLVPDAGGFSMLWLGALRCDGRDEQIGATRISLHQIAGVMR